MTKSNFVQVRIEPVLKARIVQAATEEGLGVSTWLRRAAMRDLAPLKSVVARKPRSAKELQSSATAVE